MRLAPEPSRGTSDDNLIPMINVIFLLLIFYMVAGTIDPPVPIETAPPDSSQRRDVAAPRTLHMSADGDLALDAEPVTLETLEEALRRAPESPVATVGDASPPDRRAAVGAGSSTPNRSTATDSASLTTADPSPEPAPTDDALPSSLAVRADGELALERLQPVLDALRTAGVTRVELVTTWVPVDDR